VKTIFVLMSVLSFFSNSGNIIGEFISFHIINFNSQGLTIRYGALAILLIWTFSAKIQKVLKERGK